MTTRDPSHPQQVRIVAKLLSLGSLDGADAGAIAAVDASISVDDVGGITGSDSVNRALIGASAASDAVSRNFVCHNTSTSI